MKKSFVAVAVLTGLIATVAATDAHALEAGQCLLSSSDSGLFEVGRGRGFDKGFLEMIMKMILQVVQEGAQLVARVLCTILNEYGVRCR